MLATSLVALAALAAGVNAASWDLTTYYSPESFLQNSQWGYFDDTDPTNGLVTYQTLTGARSLNLSYIENDQYFLRVDNNETRLDGRPSVRIYSQQNYTDGVYVLNSTHFPTGCAVWPAFWTVTSDLGGWPVGGEIDIMEMANDQYDYNLASLHTQAGCTIDASQAVMTGSLYSSDCNGSTGCRVSMNGSSGDEAANTGAAFNALGGGIYAMERSLGTTGNGIRVWFFPFDSVPDDLKNNGTSVDTSTWGEPGADFPIAQTCYNDFADHRLTFDITLCGDWAATTYDDVSTCVAQYGSCSSQVAYNGSSFDDAYFAINSVRVFGTGGGDDNSLNSRGGTNTSAGTAATASASTGSGSSTSTSGAAAQGSVLSLLAAGSALVAGAWAVMA